MRTALDICAALDLTPAQQAAPFDLRVGAIGVRVHCPEPLRSRLMAYFTEARSAQPGEMILHLLPGQSLPQEPLWTDWQREPGKTGRKDAIFDLEDGRLIRKIRSEVTFLQSDTARIAFGPLAQNESTVINFINSQFLNSALRAGWQLCHAAAVSANGRGLAIAGLSGGGKSTSILRMMDLPQTRFMSNDRLLIRRTGGATEALGIPKHPRINPGTILGNPRLHRLIPEARRAALAALDPDQLWTFEEKHDLMIGAIYGPDRMRFDGALSDFWVLNWQRDSAEATRIAPVDLASRPDLLAAIAKSPGPFYHDADGRFIASGTPLETGPCLDMLRAVRVWEVTGRIDFDHLAQAGRALFDG